MRMFHISTLFTILRGRCNNFEGAYFGFKTWDGKKYNEYNDVVFKPAGHGSDPVPANPVVLMTSLFFYTLARRPIDEMSNFPPMKVCALGHLQQIQVLPWCHHGAFRRSASRSTTDHCSVDQ